MILSDRDLRALIADGRLTVDPFDPAAVQPSSIDLRIGSQFRVFANHRYPHIDVRQSMPDLTELVEASESEPFVLHPGEFVLASTLEEVSIPDDHVARLEGKSSLGRLGLLIHSSLPASEPVLIREGATLRQQPISELVEKRLQVEVAAFDPDTFQISYHEITGWYEGPSDRIYEVVLASGRRVRVTAGHNLFTVDGQGGLTRVRTGELSPGTMVAIPKRVPPPTTGSAPIDLLSLAPEASYAQLVLEGPAVESAFATDPVGTRELLRQYGFPHPHYYRNKGRLPLTVALQIHAIQDNLGPEDALTFRGSAQRLPVTIPVDADVAWLLGLYVAEGSRRRNQVVWSNTDQQILDRVEQTLSRLGLSTYRSPGAVTCYSTLLSVVFSWLGMGERSHLKRVPLCAFSWPTALLSSFMEGFIDGDGSREGSRTSLWSSSQHLVGDFLLLAARLGLRASASFQARGTHGLYQISIPHREHTYADYHGVALSKLESLVGGDLLFDRVVEVRDTGAVEPIYDLEVRPNGRKIENFVAGYGGVMVSNTAGFVDAGFTGHLTLELSNVANLPITIYPGMKIGQLCLFQMSSPAERPYGSAELGSKYKGQQGPTASRYFENFDED